MRHVVAKASPLFREDKRQAWVFATCFRKGEGLWLSEVAEGLHTQSGNAYWEQAFTI
jgi:hypothetical protein